VRRPPGAPYDGAHARGGRSLSADLALDFGTSTTRVVDSDGRLLLDEPTVAAIDGDSGRLLALGHEALGVGAGSAGRVSIVRPVRRGQLFDLSLAEEVLSEVLRNAGVSRLQHPRILVCSHVGATKVQHRALDRALRKAGARQVRFVEQPLACAVGSSLAIEEPSGSMVVEVGGGTTDAGVLALGGLVTSRSLAFGGEDVDDAVRSLLARRHGLVVDQATAAEVCRTIGTLDAASPELRVEVVGRDARTGRTATAVLARSELRPVLEELVSPVLDAAVACITDAPPDLANDLLGRGLVLAGGGASLDGFDRRLATATGLPVHVSSEPRLCAVVGASRCLSMLDVLTSAVSAPPRR